MATMNKAYASSFSLPCTYIPTVEPRFPDKHETLSIDAGFDQSPVLKKIYDHYTKRKPSVRIVSLLSPKDFVSPSTAKSMNVMKKRIMYSEIIPSVVSVSSFLGVARKIDCSGLVIEWDATKNEATILTSAKLLWSPVMDTRENHIIVSLADGTLLLGKEDSWIIITTFLPSRLSPQWNLKR